MPAKWYRKVFEEDPTTMEIEAGQPPRLGVRVVMQDEEVEQIRAGYECINCYEPLREAWPEHCPLCGFEIKKLQPELFGKIFKGHRPGARTGSDWDRIADDMEERAEQRAFRRKMEKTGVSVPSIIVPRDI
jgi:hypothetical protein